MSARRSLTVLLALALALSLAGCGGDDKDAASSATTTTVAEDAPEGGDTGTTITAPPEDAITTTTLTSEEFTEAVAAARQALTDAGDDFCAVAKATNSLSGQLPDDTDQAKQLYELYAAAFTRLGETVPAANAADGAALKAAAQKLLADAEASGYDPESLAKNETPEAFADPAVTTAIANISEALTTNCLSADG